MDLLSITQSMFMLGFVAMAAGGVWFVLERNDLKVEHRSVGTFAAVIAFIAAVMYYVMKDVVNFPGGMIDAAAIEGTMPLRYIDWLITTPLLLVEFGLIVALAGAATKGLVSRLVIADLVMIVFGYLGETSVPGSGMAYVTFIISSLAWVYIAWLVWSLKMDDKAPAYAVRAVKSMRLFVILGWAIYPIGTATQQFITLGGGDLSQAAAIAAMIYVVADVLNKIGFGMIAVNAAKKA
ncbi:MAG TPA: bacteriorhodopsin [Microbacteriaceae bacterium]|nr:bacteriorhodopsin [Microbacteriaceae bacterium]